MCFLISLIASAASLLFTVTRTSWQPASSSRKNFRNGRFDICGLGRTHALDDNFVAAANRQIPDFDRYRILYVRYIYFLSHERQSPPLKLAEQSGYSRGWMNIDGVMSMRSYALSSFFLPFFSCQVQALFSPGRPSP